MTVSILFDTRFLPMIPRSVVAATKLVRVGRGRGARLERDHTPSSPSSRGRRREHPRLRRRAGPSRQHLRGAAPAPPSPPTADRLRRPRAHLRGLARGRSAPRQLAGGHAGVRVGEPWRRRSAPGPRGLASRAWSRAAAREASHGHQGTLRRPRPNDHLAWHLLGEPGARRLVAVAPASLRVRISDRSFRPAITSGTIEVASPRCASTSCSAFAALQAPTRGSSPFCTRPLDIRYLA